MNAEEKAWQARLELACAPYRQAGRFAWHFARGKLGVDPAFRYLLAHGLIPPAARVLDLGSGQGLLAALLRACDFPGAIGPWPDRWPTPPAGARVHGIELMPADVRRAQAALGTAADFVCGDIRTVPFPPTDVAVILDVLHYMPYEDQQRVLEKVERALTPSGSLLLRVGDAGAGLPFRISNWVDRAVTSVRGHGWVRLYCRKLHAWTVLLSGLGFRVQQIPLSQGTPFANVLLVCRRI